MFNIYESKLEDKTNHVYVSYFNKRETFIDITRAFPVTSKDGNKYVFIVYVYDQNAISSTPMKNRQKGEIIKAYNHILKYLKSCGIHPKLH